MGLHQVLALSAAVMTLCLATPPPGYVKKPDNDKDPPKYEFGYDVRDGKGGRQGHLETRDGIYALGMYYVNLPDGSEQSVRYFADDWGYHPLVSYTSSSKTGSTKTHFALGEKAVAALANSRDANPSISGSGPSALKLPEGAGRIGSDSGDIFKIRPSNAKVPINSAVGTGRKSAPSNQQIPHPSGSQKVKGKVDVSAVNNLIDSNVGKDGDSGNGNYEVVTPLYSTQNPGPSDGAYISEESPNYETGQQYQPTAAQGTGSSSYQLIEIGDSSSGNHVSGSPAPVFLPLVSEPTNTESGKSPGYRNGENLKVTSYVTNKNTGLRFGDRIPNVGTAYIPSTSNVEQDQNEIYKEVQHIVQVTTPSTPDRYSPLRPIVVAEIYPKQEDKEITATLRPIAVSPTTPASIKISHSPQSSFSFSGSEGVQSGSIFTKNHETSREYPTLRDILLQSQDTSVEHFKGSEKNSQTSGPVSNNGYSGQIVSQIYSTPIPVLVSNTKDTASISQGSSSGSTSFIDQGHAAHVKPLVYTTPAPVLGHIVPQVYSTPRPVLVSYTKDTASVSEGSSSGSTSYIDQGQEAHAEPFAYTTPAPILGHIVPQVYSTPRPVLLAYTKDTASVSEGSSSGSNSFIDQGHEAHAEPLVYTTPAPILGHIVPQVYSTPRPVLLAYTKNTASVSEGSSSGSNSFIDQGHEAHAEPLVYTTPAPLLGHISPQVYSTPRPVLVSYTKDRASVSEGSSSGSTSFIDQGHKAHVEPFAYTTPAPVLGHIVPQVYSTPRPVLLAYTKDTASVSEGSYSGSNSFIDQGHAAHAEPLVYTTPAPVLVSYSQDTSGAKEEVSQSVVTTNNGNSGNFASYTQQTPSPVFLLYSQSPTSSYSIPGVNTIYGAKSGHESAGVYSTPAPILLSQSQKSSSFSTSESEDHSQQQSFTAVNSGNAGQVIESQHSAPTTIYISHSPKSSSFSASNSVKSSQSSNSVTKTNNGNSGNAVGGNVYSTTPRPPIVTEDSSAGDYIVSSTPATIYLNSNPLPVAAALTSSAEVLAPIQAGVSLGTLSHQQPSKLSETVATSQPPQVTEQVDDIPQLKTVVEVQKAITFDLNSLVGKPNSEHIPVEGTSLPAAPTSYTQQAAGNGKQEEQSSGQQEINTGNLYAYGYGQPLFGLHVYPQIAYTPRLIESNQQLLYGYNPQHFEAQKLTQFRYNNHQQLRGNQQQQSLYEQSQQSFEEGKLQEQQQEYIQKQLDGQLQAIAEYQQQKVTEAGKAGEKYEYNQQLTESNLQNHEQHVGAEKQQVTTAYNEQLVGEEHQVQSQPLSDVSQIQVGYSQQPAQTEIQVQKYKTPVQIKQEVEYQQPLEISQQVEYQPPLQINHQIPYQVPAQVGQQVSYQAPVEVNGQIEYLSSINQHVEHTVSNADIQPGFGQQIILSPGQNQQITETGTQISEGSSQSKNQGLPAFSRNPGQVSKQLQSEYSHQLVEEERQEQVRFDNQIGETLKQIHTEYNEDDARNQGHVQVIDEKPEPAPTELPAQPPPAAITLNHQQSVVEVENQEPIVHNKLVAFEKPVAIHHTKVVERPVPVPHAVPVEVTKLVPVDRPVPYPQPYAVPHPVPVPYAVPHPIGVPVPHLVPYPHVVTVPYKELHPAYIRNGKPHKQELAQYHYQFQNFPPKTPLPVIWKALQYHGGRYGVPVSMKPHQYHSSRIPQSVYLTPPPLKSSGRGRGPQQAKYIDHLRTLCVEYGFKPPLVPSIQIDGVPPSAYGPPKRD